MTVIDTIVRMRLEAILKRLGAIEQRMAEFEQAGINLCKSGINLEARVSALERQREDGEEAAWFAEWIGEAQ